LNIKEVKNILLIRNDKIGDLLLSTTFINSIKKAVPRAKITLVVSRYAEDVMEGTALADELLIWEEKATQEKVTGNKWEVAVALSPVSDAYKMAADSNAGIRAGIVYPERPMVNYLVKKWLNRPLLLNLRKRLSRKEKVPHEIEQLEQLAFHMGLPVFDREMVVALNPQEVAKAEQKIQEKSRNFSGGLLGFQLSGRWLKQDWKISQLSELILKLRYAFPNALLSMFYGPQEADLGKELYGLLKEKPGIDFYANQNFAEWAAKVKQMDLLITPDSGGVHLASALKVPVAALYLASTYSLCSQQWAPWMVPNVKIKLQDFKRTCEELIAGVQGLLKKN